MIYDWADTGDAFLFWDANEVLLSPRPSPVALRVQQTLIVPPVFWKHPIRWWRSRHPAAKALGRDNPFYVRVDQPQLRWTGSGFRLG